MDAIVHTASPIDLTLHDPEAFVGPAARGTTGILRSMQAHDPTVKRIITISSVGAVCSLTDYPSGEGKPVRVFTDDQVPREQDSRRVEGRLEDLQ